MNTEQYKNEYSEIKPSKTKEHKKGSSVIRRACCVNFILVLIAEINFNTTV